MISPNFRAWKVGILQISVSKLLRSSIPKWSLVFALLLTLIIGPFVLFEEQVDVLASSLMETNLVGPYFAGLIVGMLTLDVILPVPASFVNAASGAALGFVFGTLVSWVGMTLGCLLGYWIGATGGTALTRKIMGGTELSRAEKLAARMGGSMLVVMRAVPVLAEASVVAAGAARYPLMPFILLTSLANLGIAAAFAGIGAYAWTTNSFLAAFAGAVGISILGCALVRIISQLKGKCLSRLRPSPKSRFEP